MSRQAPVSYRGFSIEQERDGSFSLFCFGYVAGGFKTEAEARAAVDRRFGVHQRIIEKLTSGKTALRKTRRMGKTAGA